MTRDEALTVLGLEAGATREEVSLAYRELAQMLHPDKFGDNRKLRARAEAQMSRINAARDVLLKGAGASAARKAPARPAAARTPADIAREARARARAAEAARLMVASQERTLRERRGGMLTLSVVAGLVMVLTMRMGGAIGTLAFSVSSMLVVWGLVDVFTLGNQANVLHGRVRELMRQRDEAARIADEADAL